MANIEVKEFKIKIGEKEYTFRLDFRALIKFNNVFKDEEETFINKDGKEEKRVIGAIGIFNKFLQNTDIYGCIVKILSCACIEKDFTEEELALALPFDFKTMAMVDQVTTALIDGVMGEKEKAETPKGKQGKNE